MAEEVRVSGIILGNKKASDILIRDGIVVSITKIGAGGVDAGSSKSWVAPLLFDIQVNGLRGVNLQTASTKVQDVLAITDMLAWTGIKHWVPTIITSPIEMMLHTCRTVAEAMKEPAGARAIPGVHLEGPFISPEDGPRGAHPKRYVRKPDVAEFDRLYDAAEGKILYVTLAPELDNVEALIRHIISRGAKVAIGHHNATADQIARAVDAGACLSTHLGNGLASMINRHANPLWPQLADDRLAAALIPDLEHLPAHPMKIFVRAKGPERIVLTSDCVHIAGLKPGKYFLGGQEVELLASGRICLSGTDLLAGSSLGLLQGVVNAAHVTELTLEQAFQSAGPIPAKLFGMPYSFALPKEGAKADFVLFDITARSDGRPVVEPKCVFIDGERKL